MALRALQDNSVKSESSISGVIVSVCALLPVPFVFTLLSSFVQEFALRCLFCFKHG